MTDLRNDGSKVVAGFEIASKRLCYRRSALNIHQTFPAAIKAAAIQRRVPYVGLSCSPIPRPKKNTRAANRNRAMCAKRVCDKPFSSAMSWRDFALVAPAELTVRPHPNPLPEGEGTCHTPSKSLNGFIREMPYGRLRRGEAEFRGIIHGCKDFTPTLTLPLRGRGQVSIE